MRHLLLLLLTCPLTQLHASDTTIAWARFRGPDGSGVVDHEKPPVTFGPTNNLLWKQPLPPGHSSPIVWNDHIFITAVENDRVVLLALRRRDGNILWKQPAPADKLEQVHAFSSPAASTPATDGQRVYLYVGSFGLLAFDFTGREVWRRPLPFRPNKYGRATSPIVFDGKVIVQLDGADAESQLVAVSASTGDIIWQTPRPLLRDGWSTPIVWSHDGQHEIITVGTRRVVAYDPDGKERWWVAGLTEQPVTVAVAGGGLLFASATLAGSPSDPIDIPRWNDLIVRYDANKDERLSEPELPPDDGIHLRVDVPKETPGNFLPLRRVMRMFDGNKDAALDSGEWNVALEFVRANENNVLAIRPGARGDSTGTHLAWKAQRGISEMPSPLYYRNRLYFVRDGGMVTSYMPDSGKVVLDRQRLGALGQYVASPVAADGRIYAASYTGTVVVFRAGDTLDVLARNDLGEHISATPAIADNKLYIRTGRHLWAFGS